MAFQKGQTKPAGSGRKKGTPNKATVVSAYEAFAAKGQSPAEMILERLDKLEVQDQIKVLLELLSYCQAKPKEAPSKAGKSTDDEADEGISTFDDLSDDDAIAILKAEKAVV